MTVDATLDGGQWVGERYADTVVACLQYTCWMVACHCTACHLTDSAWGGDAMKATTGLVLLVTRYLLHTSAICWCPSNATIRCRWLYNLRAC